MKKFKYLLLSTLVLGFTACNDVEDFETTEPEVALPALTAGSADFSKYVAVGASFSAGYIDGTVFIAGQNHSWPNSVATQFAKAGGGEFKQPLVSDNIGGLLFSGIPITGPRLYFDGAGPASLDAVPTTEVTDVQIGPFNNMGIPGAKSYHLLASGFGNLAGVPVGQANPYFARIASSATATVLEDAAAQNATFFTISELGGNDVLAYATGGGTGTDQTGNQDLSTYAGNDITDPTLFAGVMDQIVAGMTANSAKGAIVTIPYIYYLPYFTTVPHNPVPLDAATAGAVNAAYATYNGGIAQVAGLGAITEAEAAARTIAFSEGSNAVVIEDEDLTDLSAYGLPNYRQATEDDLIILPASSVIGTLADPTNPASVNGVGVPLADNWVLTPNEQDNITNATDAYNTTITNLASSYDLALVNVNQTLEDATTGGVMFDDYTLTAQYVTGGLVSLDGVHFTARGYALLANKVLEAIDSHYGSNFVASGNLAKAGDFPTNYSSELR